MRELTKEEKEMIVNSIDAYITDLRVLQRLLQNCSDEPLIKVSNGLSEAQKLRVIFRKFATKIYVEE